MCSGRAPARATAISQLENISAITTKLWGFWGTPPSPRSPGRQMMARRRVVHYLNQFFAGIGAEDRADEPPGVVPGAVGPGRALAEALGDQAEIVATVYCGD